MAGLTQKELADMVRTHVNTVKRFESMDRINSRADSLEGIGKALAAKGIEAGIWPTPYVRKAG